MRGGVKWVCLPFQCGSQPSEGSRRQRVCGLDRLFAVQDALAERDTLVKKINKFVCLPLLVVPSPMPWQEAGREALESRGTKQKKVVSVGTGRPRLRWDWVT